MNGRVLICGCKRIDSIQRCRPGARCAGFTPIVLNNTNTGEDGAAYRLPGFTTNMSATLRTTADTADCVTSIKEVVRLVLWKMNKRNKEKEEGEERKK